MKTIKVYKVNDFDLFDNPITYTTMEAPERVPFDKRSWECLEFEADKLTLVKGDGVQGYLPEWWVFYHGVNTDNAPIYEYGGWWCRGKNDARRVTDAKIQS